MVSGLKFRDQKNYGLQFPWWTSQPVQPWKRASHFRDRKIQWSLNNFGDQIFWFQIWSLLETNGTFGLKYWRLNIMSVSIRDQKGFSVSDSETKRITVSNFRSGLPNRFNCSGRVYSFQRPKNIVVSK